MLCVFPFHAGDAERLANLLHWIRQLGVCKKHEALLVADAGVDWAVITGLRNVATESFQAVHFKCTVASVSGWPQGPNTLFLEAAAYAFNAQVPWLWMETDAIPLHPDWLDIVENEYRADGHEYFGNLYNCHQPNLPQRLMSGIAVYPAKAYEQIGMIVAADPTKAFDVAMSAFVLPRCGHTIRIQHFWGENDLPPTFVKTLTPASPKNAFTLGRLAKNAVIFHRNKDGSLIELLRETRNIQSGPAAPARKSRGEIKVRRTASLGDVLAATCVARKLDDLGFDVTFQAHPSCHCLLRRVAEIKKIEEPGGPVEVDLDGAYEGDPQRRERHFAEMFIERANHYLGGRWIEKVSNYAPRLELTLNDREGAREFFQNFPQPWIVICPRSHSWANRTVPDATWQRAAASLAGTKFWLALHPAPGGLVDLNCRHFDRAIGFLGMADLVVTVDTGPMHVAAACGTPVVAIEQASSPAVHLSDQRDWEMIGPALNCLNCQLDQCPMNAAIPPCQNINPALIAGTVTRKLGIYGSGVACVICIYKPAVEKLNHCLRDILPQVDEIFVVSDAGGFVPPAAMQHEKIKYLRMRQRDVGYGKKMNFGMRHTSRPWVLQLNDDCYLAPDAVAKMQEVAGPGVGMVSHVLWYPNGTIQHGGTYRNAGDSGWGHLDWKARESRIKEPVEMENVCGASVLVRRKAFYEAGGFDEDFFLYCEDNAMCLQMRQAGWKIVYTPHASGIHEESQSSAVRPGIHQIMLQSQATLRKKWGWYFDKNARTIPGKFD